MCTCVCGGWYVWRALIKELIIPISFRDKIFILGAYRDLLILTLLIHAYEGVLFTIGKGKLCYKRIILTAQSEPHVGVSSRITRAKGNDSRYVKGN